MEKMPSFESREEAIDRMIEELAQREEMSADEILSDMIVFAPYLGNEDPNPDYLEQMAEMLGISNEEMTEYAVNKAKEQLGIE